MKPLDNWRGAEPTLTPQMRLLLLLARMRLSKAQVEQVRLLCAAIDDWPHFARAAAEHFVAPLCLYHLARIDGLPNQARARDALQAATRPLAMHSLALASVQQHFMRTVVEPLNTAHAAFKGRALAARYYPDPALRYCRDIDILLPVAAIPEAMKLGQEAGYRAVTGNRVMGIDESNVLARSRRVVKLYGRHNVLIEIHAYLDKAGFLIDEQSLLERAETIDVDGQSTRVPNTGDLFVFICLHHTKHFWSRLNWLADLDAMISSPDFDRAAVLQLARSRGLESTVSACLDFHAACAAADPWQALDKDAPARDLLRVCLINLTHGARTEFRLRPDRLSMDFNFDWQIPPGFRRRLRLRSIRSTFQPNIMDYRTLALPRRLYWLYYPLKPLLYLLRRSGLRAIDREAAA